jgi:hypothetical protein
MNNVYFRQWAGQIFTHSVMDQATLLESLVKCPSGIVILSGFGMPACAAAQLVCTALQRLLNSALLPEAVPIRS